VLVSEDAEIILLAEKDSSLWGAARVELLTMDGRNFSETRIYPEGDPECPLPEGEVLHKFMTLMQKPMGETRAEALWRDIQSLDENLRAGTIFHQMLSQL
jgi:hypothetical protein